MTSLFGKYCYAAGILVGVVACSSDSTSPVVLHPPDGSSCSQGTISANGATVSGTISTTSDCKLSDSWDGDSAYSASYAMAVTAGKIYSVTGTGSAAGGGAVENLLVGLTTADTEEIVAASSNTMNGSGSGNNVLWFYAPTSGTYSLRALDEDTSVKNMAFTMQVVTCPVVATVAASDTDYVDSTSSIATSGCKHQYTFFGGGDDSTFVNYYLVQFSAGQTRYFGVQSSAFTPGFEVGGPNFDSMWDLNGNGTADNGNNDYAALTADSGGTYTLDVGSTTYGGSGAYRLSILAPSLAPEHVPPGSLSQGKTVHLKASQRMRILR
jgi:hypothetical protein